MAPRARPSKHHIITPKPALVSEPVAESFNLDNVSDSDVATQADSIGVNNPDTIQVQACTSRRPFAVNIPYFFFNNKENTLAICRFCK
jgi:hypothetical protein